MPVALSNTKTAPATLAGLISDALLDAAYEADVRSATPKGFDPVFRSEVSMPAGKEAVLPAADADEDTGAIPKGRIAHMVVAIDYVDSKGQASRRPVRVMRVDDEGEDGSLWAWCFIRRCVRQFKLSRINSIFDPRTGEIFYDPWQVLENACTKDPEAAALARMADEIAVLVYIGQCDGEFVCCECDVITDYIFTCCEDLGVNEDKLAEEIKAYDPTKERTFTSALRRVRESDETHRRALFEVAKDLVSSDGMIHDEELAALNSMAKLLGITLHQPKA